jgi:hypothetical protein
VVHSDQAIEGGQIQLTISFYFIILLFEFYLFICLTYHFIFTYSIFELVTSQLAIPTKKTRFGPKVASRDWWIERIKIDRPETSYWTHFTKYQIAQFKVLAELDY